jgi:hypothetical protein
VLAQYIQSFKDKDLDMLADTVADDLVYIGHSPGQRFVG